MADKTPATDEQISKFVDDGDDRALTHEMLIARINAERKARKEAEEKAESAWNMWHRACHDIAELKAENAKLREAANRLAFAASQLKGWWKRENQMGPAGGFRDLLVQQLDAYEAERKENES